MDFHEENEDKEEIVEKEDKKKKEDKKNKDKKKMGKKTKLPQNGKWLFFFLLLAGPAPSIILHQWSSLLELLSNPFTPRYTQLSDGLHHHSTTSLKPLNWKKWGGGSPAKDPPNISQ